MDRLSAPYDKEGPRVANITTFALPFSELYNTRVSLELLNGTKGLFSEIALTAAPSAVSEVFINLAS